MEIKSCKNCKFDSKDIDSCVDYITCQQYFLRDWQPKTKVRVSAEVVENERSSDYDEQNYEVNIYNGKNYRKNIEGLTKEEAELIASLINAPQETILAIDIKGTVDDAIQKEKQNVRDIIEEMKKERDDKRPKDVSESIDPIDFNAGYKYALDELLKRVENK